MPALCILGVSGDVLLSVEMTDDSPQSQVSLRPWLLAKLREQLELTEFQSLLLHSLVIKGRALETGISLKLLDIQITSLFLKLQ